ncbi:MAG: type I-E CRISPR-associated protein Cse1/CasA, partial [Sulfurihydrogenibium sp.]|nr:type I-E CRISPR-associated protein Cse1/CasA [Sulfurihydrogenibium sp.]
YNLIHEKWIPVIIGDKEVKVSLIEAFTDINIKRISGKPTEKIAIFKFLTAIAQAAYTPKDFKAWQEIGNNPSNLSEKVLKYLNKWEDRFYLYGEYPFLQMKSIIKADVKTFGEISPEVATGNTPFFNQTQKERDLDESEKALFILTQQSFALGGKKADNSVVLTEGYTGKSNKSGNESTSKYASSLGLYGYLHSFIEGDNLIKTILVNLMTHEEINEIKVFSGGLGIPAWEQMPVGEDCDRAKQLTQTILGRLVPISRFLILSEDKKGLHYSEGLPYKDHRDGFNDLTTTIDYSTAKAKPVWVDTSEKPWRLITSLLAFLKINEKTKLTNIALRLAIKKIEILENITLYSGGLAVSSNMSEQYCSQTDDYLESSVVINKSILEENYFEQLKLELKEMEKMSNLLKMSIERYDKALGIHESKKTSRASNIFWELCENIFTDTVKNINIPEILSYNRKRTTNLVVNVFNNFCPNNTSRQMNAWVLTKPNFKKGNNL